MPGGGFDIDGVRTNVGGHVERLYPGATIDYWNSCFTDTTQGDYVTSYEKDTFVRILVERVAHGRFGGAARPDPVGCLRTFGPGGGRR